MKLNSNLAMKIVNNTVNVLGDDITIMIMNHEGIIIGSKDEKKLDTYDETAVKVIENGRPFITKNEETDNYQGAKEGINLPIKFQDEIIGVVGITGVLEKVSGYGKIVKNMVELFLQQEFLMREIEIENKAKETLFQQLLSNSIEEEDLLLDRIKLLDINTDLFRVVMVINIKPFDNKEISYEIQNISNKINLFSKEDILFIRGENLILIKAVAKMSIQKETEEILNTAHKIKQYFEKDKRKIKIAIGQIVYKLDHLCISYQDAKQKLKVGEKVYKNNDKYTRDIYHLNCLGFDFLLPSIDKETSDYYLRRLFNCDIVNLFNKNNIGEMIESLVENNINISRTANNLFIHRNTLLYRLKKIEEVTGLNPRNLKELYSLLMAYHIYKYNY